MSKQLDEANKKLVKGIKLAKDVNKPSVFRSFLNLFIDSEGKLRKLRKALDLMYESADLFKMNHKYEQAVLAYTEIAQLKIKLGDYDVPETYVNAARMAKAGGLSQQEHLEKAIRLFADSGKDQQAGDYTMEIAIDYEKSEEIHDAIKYYEKARDYYLLANSSEDYRKATIKQAHIEDVEYAEELFEEVGKQMLDTIYNFSAKEYFLKACLCELLADNTDDTDTPNYINTTIYLNRFQQISTVFYDSREANFINKLCKAIESEDVNSFVSAVTEFDTISPLDSWLTNILYKIKVSMNADNLL
jgi:alpha-soluble NSF attachment protein